MKTKLSSLISTVVLIALFIGLSLACASTPEPEDPKTTVDVAILNSWVEGLEVSAGCENPVSVIQWKFLVKELSKVGELNDITLIESKGLTAVNLESHFTVSNIPLNYSYSLIQAESEIQLKLISISEKNAEENPFSLNIKNSALESYKESFIQKLTAELSSKANELVEKKVYLE